MLSSASCRSKIHATVLGSGSDLKCCDSRLSKDSRTLKGPDRRAVQNASQTDRLVPGTTRSTYGLSKSARQFPHVAGSIACRPPPNDQAHLPGGGGSLGTGKVYGPPRSGAAPGSAGTPFGATYWSNRMS